MPKPYSLDLTPEQRSALEDARAHDLKPYVRERAAALLKIADGASARQVAAFGLLKKRRHRTISRWAERFLEEGLPGLRVREGSGRKPAFSPSVHDTARGAASGPRRRAPRT